MTIDNIRLVEENRIMREELDNQKAENGRLKRFAETYLKDNDASSSINSITYNFDIKTSNSRRRVVNNDVTIHGDDINTTNTNTVTTTNTSKCRTNNTSSNDRKNESNNGKSTKYSEVCTTSTDMTSITTTTSNDTTSSNDEQISVKNSHLASSLGLTTESAISIPKPWMKKSTKSNTTNSTTNSITNSTTNNITNNITTDTNTFTKKSNIILSSSLSSSLPFPESTDSTAVTEIDGPNSKYLHPLKNRLEELLRSVKAETTSFGEIRTSIKKRADRADRADREHHRL